MSHKKLSGRIQLFNGCSCSQFSVFPKNWKDRGASVDHDWYFTYRFYDPEFKDNPKYKYGKLVQVKGMNEYRSLAERRQMTEHLLTVELVHLSEKGFNPITKQFMAPPPEPIVSAIPGNTPFLQALNLAREKKVCDPAVKACLKSVIKYVGEAARQLRYDCMSIKDIKRPHILCLFEQLAKNKKEKWTANNYNHYRSHLLMLFEVLVLWCTIDFNPVEKVPIQKNARKKRTVLTPEQCRLIDSELRVSNFPFWLHVNIFFLSGCRRVELLRLRGKDVDMINQRFSVERRKGQAYIYVDYTIPDNAVHLWQMALVNCRPDDYVFSVGLKPGQQMIRAEQVTKRWKRWVKDRKDQEGHPMFGKDVADYYALKHLQTTEISNRLGTKVAAAFNNESEAMIMKHYDVDYEKRLHEQRKKSIKSFGSLSKRS